VHPVSGAFVRVGRRECPKICKFPRYEAKPQVRAVSGEVRERLLASPGAGDYPPDFLAHEIGSLEPYVIDGSPRARPNWLKEMDDTWQHG